MQVFDIGVGDNAFFIVMEYVDGANLKGIAESVKKQGKDFPVQAAAWVAHEICKGLSYAHELTDQNGMPMNLVHRDMSPPNVLVTKYGEVKIVDFGLAKASSQLEKSEPRIIKGKFSYLSPEAALGQEVDKRTDIFAVGIILWELLAGQRLFLGDTDFQTVKKVQVAAVPPISQINRKVPPELERIVKKALAKDMLARYGTAQELGQDLSRFMFSYGQPISKLRHRRHRAGHDAREAACSPAARVDHRQADRRSALRVHFIKRRRGARFRKYEDRSGCPAEHGLVRRPHELGERDRHRRGEAPRLRPASRVTAARGLRAGQPVCPRGRGADARVEPPRPPAHALASLAASGRRPVGALDALAAFERAVRRARPRSPAAAVRAARPSESCSSSWSPAGRRGRVVHRPHSHH